MSVTSPPAIAGGTPIRVQPLPYGRHHLDDADIAAVVAALRSGTLTGGAAIADFEHALAARCNVDHAVAVANGSVALDLAVLALGVGPGDEVITTPLTFVATANAVLRAGATPVFADIGDDRCLEPESVARAVTPRTKAVITVDYSGLPSDIAALRAALPRPLPIIADSAHSLGASQNGRPVGSLADITTLSFHPVKQITTGEGGACLTSDADVADRIRKLRNHGMTSTADERTGALWKYDVTMLGDNHRITALQAALGTSQLRRLDDVVAERSEIADRYDAHPRRHPRHRSSPSTGGPPERVAPLSRSRSTPTSSDASATRSSTRCARRESRRRSITPPCTCSPLYRERGGVPGTAPRAERLCDRLVTLPLYPAMTVLRPGRCRPRPATDPRVGGGARGPVVTPRALLAADCGRGVGLGHIERMLALADALTPDMDVSMLLPAGRRVAAAACRRSGPRAIDAPGDTPERVTAAVGAAPFDVIVLDGYVFDVELQRRLRDTRAADSRRRPAVFRPTATSRSTRRPAAKRCDRRARPPSSGVPRTH